jgi:aspartate 1-decarboxylase
VSATPLINTIQNKFDKKFQIPYFCFLMQIQVLKSKIHRVKVTQADLNYIGSVTIDQNLMDAAGMIEHEKVQIVNVNNGERLETYIIKGKRASGTICLNGPAARKVEPGDIVIIISYALMDFEDAKKFKPSIIFPNEKNKLS